MRIMRLIERMLREKYKNANLVRTEWLCGVVLPVDRPLQRPIVTYKQ